MDLYVIRRKSAWGNLQELENIGAKSAKIGNDEMPDRVRWIRSYVVKEPDGRFGSVCIYQAKDPQGRVGRIRHVIWSDALVCPACKRESLYAHVAVKRKPLRFVDQFVCPHCPKKASIDEVRRDRAGV